jgi:hypothetical protein
VRLQAVIDVFDVVPTASSAAIYGLYLVVFTPDNRIARATTLPGLSLAIIGGLLALIFAASIVTFVGIKDTHLAFSRAVLGLYLVVFTPNRSIAGATALVGLPATRIDGLGIIYTDEVQKGIHPGVHSNGSAIFISMGGYPNHQVIAGRILVKRRSSGISEASVLTGIFVGKGGGGNAINIHPYAPFDTYTALSIAIYGSISDKQKKPTHPGRIHVGHNAHGFHRCIRGQGY